MMVIATASAQSILENPNTCPGDIINDAGSPV